MCARARVLNPKGREYISNEQNEMGHFDPSNGGICVRKRGVFLASFAGFRPDAGTKNITRRLSTCRFHGIRSR